MIKKLSFILLSAIMLTACSDSTKTLNQKKGEKTEQSNAKETENLSSESSKKTITSAQMNEDDQQVYNAVQACYSYFPNTYTQFKLSSIDTKNFTIDDDKVKQSLFLAEGAFTCVNKHFNMASGTVIFPKSLDAIIKTSTNLVYFKAAAEMYMKNYDKKAYVLAASRIEEMIKIYEEFGKVFSEEAKQAGIKVNY